MEILTCRMPELKHLRVIWNWSPWQNCKSNTHAGVSVMGSHGCGISLLRERNANDKTGNRETKKDIFFQVKEINRH